MAGRCRPSWNVETPDRSHMAIKKANPSWIDVKAKLADFDRPSLFGLLQGL